MEMTLSLVGVGGDARLTFTDKHIRLAWAETTSRERKQIARLIKSARKAKFEVVTVDADGKADKPATWRALPGMFGKGKGELLLQGTAKAIQAIACEILDAEIKSGSKVAALQPNGEWKITTLAEVAANPEEKKELVATKPVGGG